MAAKANDGCKGDQKNIGMHCVEARERVGGFCIVCTHKEWRMGQYVWLGSFKWANGPQNRNLHENGMGKCYASWKFDDQNGRKTLVKARWRPSTTVNDGQQACSSGDQRLNCGISNTYCVKADPCWQRIESQSPNKCFNSVYHDGTNVKAPPDTNEYIYRKPLVEINFLLIEYKFKSN